MDPWQSDTAYNVLPSLGHLGIKCHLIKAFSYECYFMQYHLTLLIIEHPYCLGPELLKVVLTDGNGSHFDHRFNKDSLQEDKLTELSVIPAHWSRFNIRDLRKYIFLPNFTYCITFLISTSFS